MHARRTTQRALLFAAILTVASLVGCEPAGATKSEEVRGPADLSLAAKIEMRFAADPEVSPFEIDVDVRDGVVRLSGAVEAEAERKEAEDLARGTAGAQCRASGGPVTSRRPIS